jgi:hypothetical protein
MRLINHLRTTHPTFDLGELAALEHPRPVFEGFDELRNERGELVRMRVYTVEGHTLDAEGVREVIIIPADLPVSTADTLAHAGLRDTILAARAMLRPLADEVEASVDAREHRGTGLSAEDADKFGRMFADKAAGKL